MDKHQAVMEHLKENGTITSMEAIEEYGATRLSAIIFDLRHGRGMDIETIPTEGTDRYGHKMKYATYRLASE